MKVNGILPTPDRFSYLVIDNDNKPVSGRMTCKDYIKDFAWGLHLGKTPYSGGGNYFDPKVHTWRNTPRRSLLVGYNTNETGKKIEAMKAFLNEWETLLGFQKTHIELVENDERWALVEFDEKWFAEPQPFSLYLLLLRLSPHYQNEGIGEFIGKYRQIAIERNAAREEMERLHKLLIQNHGYNYTGTTKEYLEYMASSKKHDNALYGNVQLQDKEQVCSAIEKFDWILKNKSLALFTEKWSDFKHPGSCHYKGFVNGHVNFNAEIPTPGSAPNENLTELYKW